MTEKLQKQDEKIHSLENQFISFKEHVDGRFDSIMEQLKPTFTNGQKYALLVTVTTLMMSASVYIGNGKSDTRNNTTEIEHLKQLRMLEFQKFEEILDVVNSIKTDVEVLKVKEEG